MTSETTCNDPSCFFCIMNESDTSLRKAGIVKFFREMPHKDDQEHVLVLSGIWHIAMTHPDDPEFPSSGIFDCMAKLILRSINDKEWLLRGQNIYIPYYATHIIGSYTMNKAQFAERAVKSGVLTPLLELFRGKITWVEQRVAVRALGHIASHDKTFELLADNEKEIVTLAKETASTCLDRVYEEFISVKDKERLKYHSDLLTRGLGGMETENRKAEEWASQLQCWSLYLLNCFAGKERSLDLICETDFLKHVCKMWSGLANNSSPGGVGLIRTLCRTKAGRKYVAGLKEVIESLCNISRSSDDWRYMAIDSSLSLLRDLDTRYKVIDTAVIFLADLVELRTLKGRKKLGETITQTILKDYHKIKYGNMKLKSKEAERAMKEIWDLKVERRKREKLMPEQEFEERKLLVSLFKKEGNQKFWTGEIEKAVLKYSEALELCPLRMRQERIVLHSNRAQCYLLLRNPEAAISDSTRALCLSSHKVPHGKSLWRRSQAYDMKGLAKESLLDCLVFVNGRRKAKNKKHVKIPHYAASMIAKQMSNTWIFASAKLRSLAKQGVNVQQFNQRHQVNDRNIKKEKGLGSIEEEFFIEKKWRRKMERTGGRKRILTVPTSEFAHVRLG